MKFGKLNSVDGLNFQLGSTHPKTEQLLKSGGASSLEIKVGCAKWGRPEWVGHIYPEKTSAKNYLMEYGKQFNGIELNSTHYGIKNNTIIEGWAQKVNEGFSFSPKFPQTISHIYRLKNAHEPTVRFYDSISRFENKLGTSFLQLPPNFSPRDLSTIEKYLDKLPNHIPICIELRHAEWFNNPQFFEDVFDLFENYDVGSVITDTAGRRDCVHQRLTNSTAFIRFVGNDLHASDYSRIDEWVIRIKEWKDLGLEKLYFYMHQENEFNTPVLCDYLIQKLNIALSIHLQRPKFIQPQPSQSSLF